MQRLQKYLAERLNVPVEWYQHNKNMQIIKCISHDSHTSYKYSFYMFYQSEVQSEVLVFAQKTQLNSTRHENSYWILLPV